MTSTVFKAKINPAAKSGWTSRNCSNGLSPFPGTLLPHGCVAAAGRSDLGLIHLFQRRSRRIASSKFRATTPKHGRKSRKLAANPAELYRSCWSLLSNCFSSSWSSEA